MSQNSAFQKSQLTLRSLPQSTQSHTEDIQFQNNIIDIEVNEEGTHIQNQHTQNI